MLSNGSAIIMRWKDAVSLNDPSRIDAFYRVRAKDDVGEEEVLLCDGIR